MIALIFIVLSIVILSIVLVVFFQLDLMQIIALEAFTILFTTMFSSIYAKFRFKYGFKIKLFETFKPNTLIRVSASYLYRINIKDKYMLVLSKRLKDKYQPIGGVYQYYNSAKGFLESIGFLNDDKMEITEKSENDIRIFIPAKNITKFLDWYYSGKDRETSYDREFEEEVLKTSILSNKFANIKTYKITKDIKLKIEFSEYYNCYEILPKDIIGIEFTEEQKEELTKLYAKSSKKYIWATKEEIESLGVTKNNPTANITNHSKYII